MTSLIGAVQSRDAKTEDEVHTSKPLVTSPAFLTKRVVSTMNILNELDLYTDYVRSDKIIN